MSVFGYGKGGYVKEVVFYSFFLYVMVWKWHISSLFY